MVFTIHRLDHGMKFSNYYPKAFGPIVTKFRAEPSGSEGKKCSNSQGYMTNIATMPVYDKNL